MQAAEMSAKLLIEVWSAVYEIVLVPENNQSATSDLFCFHTSSIAGKVEVPREPVHHERQSPAQPD
jgi:hypothetical protein